MQVKMRGKGQGQSNGGGGCDCGVVVRAKVVGASGLCGPRECSFGRVALFLECRSAHVIVYRHAASTALALVCARWCAMRGGSLCTIVERTAQGGIHIVINLMLIQTTTMLVG